MGENKHINELDVFTKNLVKQIEPATVSVDFSSKVMQQIMAQQKIAFAKSQPLISNKIWFLVAVFTGIVLFLPNFFESSKTFDSTLFKMSYFKNINWNLLDVNLNIGTTSFYAILFFGLMLGIQIIFLKNYYSKKSY